MRTAVLHRQHIKHVTKTIFTSMKKGRLLKLTDRSDNQDLKTVFRELGTISRARPIYMYKLNRITEVRESARVKCLLCLD